MFRWQRNFIDKNIYKLIENTTCNVLLLTFLSENNVITQEEHILLCDEMKTSYWRSWKLYTILKTRTGAFDLLLKALDVSKQSGAVKILGDAQEDEELHYKYRILTYEEKYIQHNPRYNFTIHKGNFGNRNALVKIFHNAGNFNQVKNELDILTSFDWHENILRCYTAKFVTRGPGQSYAMALDYRSNLVQFSQDLDTSSISMVLINQILNGVRFLHQQRIVHANLKAESLFICGLDPMQPNVKIGEFGLAKKLRCSEDTYSISIGTLKDKGAASFETPEVLKCLYQLSSEDEIYVANADVSFYTDVFCLGVLLYFVLSGGKHAFGFFFDKAHNVHNNKIQLEETYFIGLTGSSRKVILNMMSPFLDIRPVLNTVTILS